MNDSMHFQSTFIASYAAVVCRCKLIVASLLKDISAEKWLQWLKTLASHHSPVAASYLKK